MSVVSLKGHVSHDTPTHILDLDHEWFEAHPDRFCRVRRALPDEFSGAEYVAVMRHPGLGRIRTPIVLAARRVDNGTCGYTAEKGVLDETLALISELKIKELFARAGVPVRAFERAWRQELRLGRAKR